MPAMPSMGPAFEVATAHQTTQRAGDIGLRDLMAQGEQWRVTNQSGRGLCSCVERLVRATR